MLFAALQTAEVVFPILFGAMLALAYASLE